MDYQGNSKKAKEKQASTNSKAVEPRTVEKVIVSEVIVKKKPLSDKVKNLIIEVDPKGIAEQLFWDRWVPSIKLMVFDFFSETMKLTLFRGEGHRGSNVHRPGPRYDYTNSNPLIGGRPSRDPRGAIIDVPSSMRRNPTRMQAEQTTQADYIVTSMSDAERILDTMREYIDRYDVVKLAEFHEMLGLQSTPIEHRWGWINLIGASVKPVQRGFLIDLPPAEPLPPSA